MEKYDICITGGGIAGCAAAYIGAKLGLKTVLIEKNNFLGGLMSGGLVVPVMKTNDENINVVFYSELVKKLKSIGGQVKYFDGNEGWFNPELLKIALDSMLYDAGVDIFFEMNPTQVFASDNQVECINYESNMLSLSIYSKYFIDSTGDSKIFKLLGQKFYQQNEAKQPYSLRFVMANVNLEMLRDFLLEIDKNRDVTNSCIVDGQIHLTSAYTWDNKDWGLKPLFDKAIQNGDLEQFDSAYFQIFTVAGANGSVAFNCPRLRDFNPFDPFDYSNAIIEARKSIFRLSNFVKKYFKGFENAYISNIASITGKRETNKIIAKKQYTFDLMKSGMPQNPVLCGDYPIDMHSNQKDASILEKTGKYYLIIDSLLSRDYNNLYAAGRNLGATNVTQAALRTQKNCMSMGEAVSRHIYKILNYIK